jgi:hypothetical protein
VVEEGGQLGRLDVLELAESGRPEIVDHIDGLLQVAIEKILHDPHAVVQLASSSISLR